MTNDDRRTELASALLDGTLPDEAAAAARRDPAVMARVAQLEQARDRVRDVPLPPVEARDAMLAAALEAFDAAPPASPVSDLQARRRDRGERRHAPRWLGAAAAVALVLAGVGAVAILGQQSEDHANESALTAADESGGGDSAQERASGDQSEAGAAVPEAPATTAGAPGAAPAQLGDLGSFATATDLVAQLEQDQRVRTLTDGAADASGAAPDAALSATGCASGDLPQVLEQPDSLVVALGRASVDGEAVSVWVADTPSGRRIVVVDANCRTVANQPLG